MKKEFAVYFGKAGNCAQSATTRYPRLLYGAMVGIIILSLLLSFTVFNKPPVVDKSKVNKEVRPLSDGFDRILRTGAALKETMAIKKQVDSLTAKKLLNHSDSIGLEKALDRLQQLNNPIILTK
nr:hypothetical protein [Mucilaginibacter sp. FT3.2]